MSILDKMAERHYTPETDINSETSTKKVKHDLNGNKKKAMEFFQSKGLTNYQAAGIVGNLIQESNLNTTIKGDGGKAFGIA